MDISESNDVERALRVLDIHQQWISSYYGTAENERFYEEAFDYITSFLTTPKKTIFLDAGCGNGAHSVRLAKRGFPILAIDFSESILKTAELNLQSLGLTDSITLQRENILSLSFPDETFDYILSWGVLLHIPDVEKAMSELDRVLKRGGFLIISEVNMFSVQSMLLRSLKLFIGQEKDTVIRTAAGLEYWELTPFGKLLTRQANVRWLKESFKSKEYIIIKHVAGQFTELYTRFSSPLLRKFIHGFNRLWFKYVKIPNLAFGNILILQKKK